MKYQTILLNYSHEIVKNLQSDLIHYLNATNLYLLLFTFANSCSNNCCYIFFASKSRHFFF